jgi:RIP metalloprotease RseP
MVVILALVVMITLHELGHFVMAKRAGMKVTEFFLGFGPKIWSTRRGETEYGIKAIPAGAYVKIIGMHNIEPVDPGRGPHLPPEGLRPTGVWRSPVRPCTSSWPSG